MSRDNLSSKNSGHININKIEVALSQVVSKDMATINNNISNNKIGDNETPNKRRCHVTSCQGEQRVAAPRGVAVMDLRYKSANHTFARKNQTLLISYKQKKNI